MADLNIALILRLVDKATAPARTALRQVERAGMGMQRLGRDQLALSGQQIAAAQARSGALMGEAAALAASGYAMSRMLAPAVKFEAAMSKVGAVSRASDLDLERLNATARKLGAETPWSATQAAEGMQYLAMAGFKVSETVEAMPGMLDLASAGAIDLGAAADIASNVLTGFNMKASETGHLGDVLVNTFTTSNTTLSSLGETMKYVAPAAASLGVDLETAAAMAGKLGDAGIQGSEAGTALRAVITRLAAPSNAAAEVLENLKVQTADANGNLRAVPELLAEIDEKMRGYGSAARSEMIKTLFETEAMSAATVLLGQAGSGSLQDYAASLEEAGSAARVAAQMNDNTAGALKTMQSRAEALAITIGTVLLPEVVNLLDTLVPLMDRFSAWSEANPRLIRSIARLTALVFAMRAGLLLVRLGVQTVTIAYWLFNGALAAVIWSAGTVLRVLGFATRAVLLLGRIAAGAATLGLRILGGALRFVGRAFLWMGRMALANPVLAVVAALAAAAYVIYDNWDGITAWFWAKIDAVSAAFDEGLLSGVLKLIAEFNPFTLMFEAATSFFTYVTGWTFEDVTNALKSAFDFDLFGAGVALIKSLGEGIWSVLTGMVEAIQAKLSGIVPDWMQDAWNWVSGEDAPEAGEAGGAPASSPAGPPPPGRALGGAVRAGQIYRWMEEGEEFFSPQSDGSVISNREVRAMRSGQRAGAQFSMGDVVIHAHPSQSPLDIARAVRRELEKFAQGSALHDGGDYAG